MINFCLLVNCGDIEGIVNLGTPKIGELVRGVCGMGMYNFVVNFE